jgi:hypothetical protein
LLSSSSNLSPSFPCGNIGIGNAVLFLTYDIPPPMFLHWSCSKASFH